MKVAIVYDRVNKWGGAERVLLALHKIFPKAPLYTSVYDPKGAPWAKVFPKIIPSFLQRISFAKRNHEFFAFFMPFVFSRFDFGNFDLVISVTSEAAKGIKTSDKTKHICYCLTPTRYLWSGYNEYFKREYFRGITRPVVNILRKIDKRIAQNPDQMIAISTEVQKRIKKYYGRDSKIISPPVEINHQPLIINHQSRNYYLLVSRLDYGYKKVDLAIKAFNKLGYPLVIVGTGREEKKLKKMAGKNIKFAGRIDEPTLMKYYREAKALIMPQEEDFGIVAVEAQSHGTPVIAFKKGGAIDTVISGKTGIFFSQQKMTSLIKAVKAFEKMKFKPQNLIRNSESFSFENFRKGILALLGK